MANISQATNLEGLHHEMHGIAKQIKVMNENNACLIQHLPQITRHLLLHLSQKMLVDLAVLIDQEIVNIRVTTSQT